MKKDEVINVVIPLKHLKDVCRYYEFPLAVLVSPDVKLPKGTRKLHVDHKIERLKKKIDIPVLNGTGTKIDERAKEILIWEKNKTLKFIEELFG